MPDKLWIYADDQLMTKLMCMTWTDKMIAIPKLSDQQLAELILCTAEDHPFHTYPDVIHYIKDEIVARFMFTYQFDKE